MTLSEHAGKTALTENILYQTKEHRDGHLMSGMEPGVQETFNRLDEAKSRLQKFISSGDRSGA
jgi:hypothetical protein